MLPIRPIVESFEDGGSEYKYIFYFAKYNYRFMNPQIKVISPDQATEIDDIRWIGSAEINQLCDSERIKQRMLRIFKIIRRIKM